MAFFTTDLLEEKNQTQTLRLIGIVRGIFTQSVCCMNYEIRCCIIGHVVRYMIPKLHFPSSRTWKCKGKSHPMTCLSRHRRKAEVYFHLIHNPAIKGSECSAPAGFPPSKTRYQFCKIVGEFWGRFGRERKISPPTGIRTADRPDRNTFIYPLRHPGHHTEVYVRKHRDILFNQLKSFYSPLLNCADC